MLRADVMKTKGHQTLLCVWYEKPQTQPEHQELVAKGKGGGGVEGLGRARARRWLGGPDCGHRGPEASFKYPRPHPLG